MLSTSVQLRRSLGDCKGGWRWSRLPFTPDGRADSASKSRSVLERSPARKWKARLQGEDTACFCCQLVIILRQPMGDREQRDSSTVGDYELTLGTLSQSTPNSPSPSLPLTLAHSSREPFISLINHLINSLLINHCQLLLGLCTWHLSAFSSVNALDSPLQVMSLCLP